MALPRVCILARSLLSRGSSTRIASSVFRSPRVAIVIPQREFGSRAWLRKEAVQDQVDSSESSAALKDIPEAQRRKNARSVFMGKVPKRATKADVEKLFKEHDLEIVDIELRMDRFTFYNDRSAFVELATVKQAQKAVKLLHLNMSFGNRVPVVAIRPDYEWGIDNNKEYQLGQNVIINDSGLDAAIQPYLESRRLMFSVLPPAWAPLDAPISERNKANQDVLVRSLETFGIESIGRISPNWGDKKKTPRFMCFVDMKTKQGAEEAVRKVHNTTIQGLEVWLAESKMAAWRAYQLGKVDKEKLRLLQEKGLAPPPEEIDEERYSKPFIKKGPRSR